MPACSNETRSRISEASVPLGGAAADPSAVSPDPSSSSSPSGSSGPTAGLIVGIVLASLGGAAALAAIAALLVNHYRRNRTA